MNFAAWRWDDWLGSSLPPRGASLTRNTRIAVLDSGLANSHPALRGARIGASLSFVGEDPLHDVVGHGTASVGVLAAQAGCGGPAGLVPEATLLVGQVIAANGEGSVATLCAGLRWAMELSATSVAVPAGLPFADGALELAVADLMRRGVAVFAAAGNPYADQSGPMYPAAYAGVRCVGASAYAADYARWRRAPDVQVPTHYVPVVDPPSAWRLSSGTSIATMIAAGIYERERGGAASR